MFENMENIDGHFEIFRKNTGFQKKQELFFKILLENKGLFLKRGTILK